MCKLTNAWQPVCNGNVKSVWVLTIVWTSKKHVGKLITFLKDVGFANHKWKYVDAWMYYNTTSKQHIIIRKTQSTTLSDRNIEVPVSNTNHCRSRGSALSPNVGKAYQLSHPTRTMGLNTISFCCSGRNIHKNRQPPPPLATTNIKQYYQQHLFMSGSQSTFTLLV